VNDLRPTYKTPLNKRYFHKKRIIEKQDISEIKRNLEIIKKKSQKKFLKENKFKKI
jgi:hypothetical protein